MQWRTQQPLFYPLTYGLPPVYFHAVLNAELRVFETHPVQKDTKTKTTNSLATISVNHFEKKS